MIDDGDITTGTLFKTGQWTLFVMGAMSLDSVEWLVSEIAKTRNNFQLIH